MNLSYKFVFQNIQYFSRLNAHLATCLQSSSETLGFSCLVKVILVESYMCKAHVVTNTLCDITYVLAHALMKLEQG